MAYTDVNTPVIERITLPSGNTYYIADREIRDVVDALSQTVAGGVAFIVAWDGKSTPIPANIPRGVTVTYNGTAYTGTLSAETTGAQPHAQAGAFYLVKSNTTTGCAFLQWDPEFNSIISDISIDTDTFFNRVTLRPSDNTYTFTYWDEQDVQTGGRDYGWEVTTNDGGNRQRFDEQNSTYLGIVGINDAGILSGEGQASFTVQLTTNILDIYDEYVPIGTEGSKTWEKIGDTQIELSNVVTNVSLTKQTDTVIGTNATFKVTQPTVALDTDSTSGAGKVQVVTGITSASASGDSVTAVTGLGTPSTDTFLKSVKVTTQPTISLTANTATATGRITYVQSQGTATTTKVSGETVDNDDDTVAAITSLGTPTTQSAVKSVTPTTKKLSLGSVTGVQSNTTTASKATASAAQTTATGGWTALNPSNTDANSNSNPDVNENLLANISVSNGVLSIGAATLNTQSTPQYTFSDVIVPIKAASATTVATGGTTTTGSGADIVTDVSVGDTFNAVTGYTPTTDNVLGSDTTFTTTLASGTTGDITVATGIGAATTRYLSASASGTAVGADGTADAVTALGTPTTDTVLGTGSTITVTPTTTNIKATATGGKTEWQSKDTVTVLTNATNISVTKGTNE
jgi:hypothetical protein